MRKLSEHSINGLAYCHNCREYFIDDISLYGSIKCPNQKCDFALYRIPFTVIIEKIKKDMSKIND